MFGWCKRATASASWRKTHHLLRHSRRAVQHHLDGHQPIQSHLACLVDNAHAAAAQFPEDLVARYLRRPGAGLANTRQGGVERGWQFQPRQELGGHVRSRDTLGQRVVAHH